ncbi:MAG: carbohydrate ABC transporter permease [Clostridiales bacterium]|nr:carbohydrate ABC transporter permease [Clostridiales bacterium]
MDAVVARTATITSDKKVVSMRRRRLIVNTILFVVLLLGAIVMLYPLLWMLFTSFKNYTEIYDGLFPKHWTGAAYKYIFTEKEKLPTSLVRGFINSVLCTVPVVLVQVFVSAMAAFAFAKLHFKGKNILFIIMLATQMIPFTVIMIPQVYVFRTFGLLNGPIAVIIPKMFGAVMTVFFLRQFLYGIPDALTEAARLDGAGYNRTFFSIVLPLIMPALSTQMILSFIGNWNDYLGPLLYIVGEEWYTLPLIIDNFAGNDGGFDGVPRIMAASLISMVPILVIFAAFQKKIVGSIVFSAVKG